MFGLNSRQLFFLAIFIALLLAATQYGPGYYAAFQFNDFTRQEVKFAASARKDINAVRADLLMKAMELGIPLTKNDIHITKRGPSFTVQLEYHWPVDMKIYHQDLVFHSEESGEVFENASN